MGDHNVASVLQDMEFTFSSSTAPLIGGVQLATEAAALSVVRHPKDVTPNRYKHLTMGESVLLNADQQPLQPFTSVEPSALLRTMRKNIKQPAAAVLPNGDLKARNFGGGQGKPEYIFDGIRNIEFYFYWAGSQHGLVSFCLSGISAALAGPLYGVGATNP
ncbi:MAG: hypothetical protein HRT61_22110, partial [Ekhidna sp.]|nr:hypothetical protein [Ekhidna sp.]